MNNNTTTASPNDDSSNQGNINIPNERWEINLKTSIFRFIKDKIEFQGSQEIVDNKARDLTSGLYEIFISHR